MRLRTGRAKLLAARARRRAPYIDRSILLSWNGMMAAAYLDAWACLGRRDCRDFAVKTLDRLLAEGRAADGGLYHVLTEEGRGKHPGFLDDQVQVAWAAVRAYETTGEARFLAAAEQLADHVLARYWDAETGGCVDVARDAHAEAREPLSNFGASLTAGFADTPTPGANAVLGRLLVRLGHHTSAPGYREKAERTLQAYAGGVRGQGLMSSTYVLAVDEFLDEPAHVVVVGPRGPETARLHLAALGVRRPGTVVTVVHPGAAPGDLGRLPAAVRGMLATAAGPTAFVCAGTRCAPPVTDPEALPGVVETFAVGDARARLGGANRSP
jgi:uncharacterized protein YyaL (SSP411 family)